MNLNHAEYILAILDAGSLSAAAKKLFISQPALSQTVRLVEKSLGVAIFERRGGKLCLTCAGERYANTVRQMLLLEHNLKNEIDEIKREHGGFLRFGIPVQYSMTVLPSLLPKFQKEYPLVRMDITEKGSSDLARLVAQGSLDMALIRGVMRESELTYIQLQEESMGLLVGSGCDLYHQYPDGTVLDITQAADEKFVFMREGHSSRITQDKLTEKYSLSLCKLLELDSFETAKEVAISCGGVMVAPYTVLQRDKTLKSRARFYPLRDADNNQNTFLIYNTQLYLTRYMQSWSQLLQNFYLKKGV